VSRLYCIISLVAFIGAFLSYTISQDLAGKYVLEVAVVLLLMAVTDHPVNLALLLKNLGYAKTNWWPKFCKASGFIFIICKLVSAGLAIPVLINARNGNDASWQVINHMILTMELG